MALTDNPMAETDNLLKFATLASTNIQEAFVKQSKKRRVNVRKYALKRVKRLDAPSKPLKLNTNTPTKSKSAQIKPDRQRQMLTHHSWPELTTVAPYVPQTTGAPTCSQPTLQMRYSYSEPSMYTDPELDNLLTGIIELESSSSSSHSPPASRPASTSPTPSQPTLENQVVVAECPISPYSSCSEEVLDSAYSSPINSYNCSPVAPVSVANPMVSCADWGLVNSPPMALPPFSTGYNSWVEQPISTACGWMPQQQQNTLTVTSSSVCNQVPMTPTVSQLLDQWPIDF